MPTVRANEVFLACDDAIQRRVLISRRSRRDKEFHFQDWFKNRLDDVDMLYEEGGRNSYPDFRLVEHTEGYEVKGLGSPGRIANYDCNSQVPTGFHNGRRVWYVFGRYPSDVQEDAYPVIDLVVCDGDFLNADHQYSHKNKNFKTFGSYGDIMVRDRKMYVAPTPYALTDGTTGQVTLILKADDEAGENLEYVGALERVETDRLVVSYSFDLRTNELTPEYVKNPNAGNMHSFKAYRSKGMDGPPVRMRSSS